MATAPIPLKPTFVPQPNVAQRSLGRSKAFCRIWVSGKDVTERFDPHLLTVKITDKLMAIDVAVITLDDRYGTLAIPADGEPLRIGLGWRDSQIYNVFEGTVTDVEHYGQKGQGRNMQIEANAVNFLQKSKQPLKQTWEETSKGVGVPLKQVLEEAAKAAGINSTIIDQTIGEIRRPSWMMTNESFINFAQRIAREIGGLPKIANQDGKDLFSMSDAKSGKAADGSDMTLSEARAGPGGTLIGWRIKPLAARAQWKGSAAEWFDSNAASWDRTLKEITGGAGGWFGRAQAEYTNQATQGDKDSSEKQAGSDGDTSLKERGKGWVVIDGEPQAQAGSYIEIKGIRHGVDGRYRIAEAEHTYSKKSGYTTRCDVDNPMIQGELASEWDKPSGAPPAQPDTRTPGSTGTPETGQ